MSNITDRKICIDSEGTLYIEMMFDRKDSNAINEVIALYQNPKIRIEVKDIDEDYVYLNVWGLLDYLNW